MACIPNQPLIQGLGYVQGNTLASGQRRNLYNGNIGSMAVNIRKLSGGTRDTGPMIYNYQYDQLNRLVSMDPWAANGSFTPTGSSALPDFAERYTYDPNGNILTLSRNGDSSHNAMDNLTYNYLYAKTGGGVGEYIPGAAPTTGVDHLTNQLSSINDAVGATSYYPNDIENQSAYNYQYDAIGNMVSDAASGITGSNGITWSVYGKILTITNGSGTITYTYDASGNRISKSAAGITTWYVRDARGNVMSVYTQGDATHNSGSLTQTEAHLYGSNRLGLLNLNVNCTNLVPSAEDSLIRGSKLFELSNHLGNVLATISDKKLQHTSDGSTVDYYNSDVIGANDYYSFGMLIPGRAYNNGSYRYGFNGKENDNEVKGVGNQQDYGMRVYDPRIGKFLSVDPVTKNYPELTPYQFASNRPIDGTDLDGKEWELSTPKTLLTQQAEQGLLTKQNANEAALKALSQTATFTQGQRNTRESIERRDNIQFSLEINKNMQINSSLDPVSFGGDGGFGQGLVRDPLFQLSRAIVAPPSLYVDFAVGAGLTYDGFKKGDWGQTAEGGLMMLGIFGAKGVLPKAPETYYRTMSAEDFASMQKTGKIPASSETFLSPTAAYSSKYQGVLVEINTKPGTFKALLDIGVKDPTQPLTTNLRLPTFPAGGWKATNAFFKEETGQINIGLGTGKALETFNSNIISFKKL